MTKWQRVKHVLTGLLSLLFVPLLMWDAELGCVIIVLVLGFSAAAKGLGMLLFHATMARHMVGGRIILYQGVILLDFGLFTIGIADIPSQYIMLYLLLGHLVYGVVEILRALELREKRLGAWRGKLLLGAGNIALGILCLVFIGSPMVTVAIYGLGIVTSALGRILSAFRPSAVVYVAAP